MRRGWHWDFEDDERATKLGPPAPSASCGAPAAPASHRTHTGLAAATSQGRGIPCGVGSGGLRGRRPVGLSLPPQGCVAGPARGGLARGERRDGGRSIQDPG